MSVKPIPEGYHTITPYLIAKDARGALEYYKKAFEAKELFAMEHDGKIGHCEFKVGDSPIMMADEFPDMGSAAPAGGTRYSTLLMYVPDVDNVFRRAVELGAKVIREPKNEFYGDRMATIMDPWGHKWHLATHVEDVSPEEMEKRAKAHKK
jgi:PhnB protein